MTFPAANSKPLPHHYIICKDCGGDGWGPMLRNFIWNRIAPDIGNGSRAGFLCETDMIRRLGRPLRSSDLRDCPMNARHPLYTPHGGMHD